MSKRKVILIYVSIVLLFTSGYEVFSQSNLKKQDSITWKINTDCTIPLEIGLISDKVNVLHIFAYMEAKYFNEKSLKELFECMSKPYKDYVAVDITIFSDKINLTTAIRNQLKPPPDFNPPVNSIKSDCANPTKAIRPCPKGYYRAEYSRFEYEYFEYSPNPTKVKMKKIALKNK